MTEQRPSILRYPLALIACALVTAAWLAILIGVGWLIFGRLDDWIDRQVWIVRIALQCVAGLTLLMILGGGWAATTDVWQRITDPTPAINADGKKHGRHAKWHPGYDPNAEPREEGAGWHGQCPKCGFTFQWDGTTCGHCKYTKGA